MPKSVKYSIVIYNIANIHFHVYLYIIIVYYRLKCLLQSTCLFNKLLTIFVILMCTLQGTATDLVVQVVLIAESMRLQAMMATYGIQTQTPHEVEPVQIWSSTELMKV